jgi:hypothetical protein
MAKAAAMSAFDPKQTSASISCCSCETGFRPYQSARSSRYDAKRGHTAAQAAREMIGVF